MVLKILSRDISHKSDLGGVQLDLASPGSVQQAGTEMLENVRRKAPEARIEGFTVQPMIRRPFAHELIAGIADDAVFGPVILFGQGGTAVEVIGDRVIGLPPLNLILAHEMIERTRISRLLRGYRDRPPADLDSIALTLVKLSQLVCDLDRIAELDINPLLADVSGVVALDARVVLRRREQAARPIAIRPYPRELEQEIATYKGRTFLLWPIRPEDTDALVLMLSRSSPGDMRLRFFAPVKEVGRSFAARLRKSTTSGRWRWSRSRRRAASWSAYHLIADPDKQAAEFAVMVRSDLKGAGVGYALMTRILDYARTSGIARVVGEILRENSAMLHLAKELGFKAISGDDEAR